MRMFFRKTAVQHVPRAQNVQADALSKLGAAGTLKEENSVRVLEIDQPSILTQGEAVLQIDEKDMDEWYKEMWDFLTKEELPTDETRARRVMIYIFYIDFLPLFYIYFGLKTSILFII